MEKTEVKLDKTTLPKDQDWVEFETYEKTQIVGQYLEDEGAILHVDNGFTGIHNVYCWTLLEIKWEFKDWAKRKEGLAVVEGHDRFNNWYKAGAEISLGEIENVFDIELDTIAPPFNMDILRTELDLLEPRTYDSYVKRFPPSLLDKEE